MRAAFYGFAAGELSPQVEGRIDLDAMRMGCRLARNVIPNKVGGFMQRPGLLYRGMARDQGINSPVRLFQFIAGADESYVLEIGDGYMRIFFGETLVITEAGAVGRPGVVSSPGDPLRLQTPWQADEILELQIAQANDVMWMVHRNHPVQMLIRYQQDGFQFEPMTFVFPPMRDQNTKNITLAASATTGTGITLTAVGGDVFAPGDVGGYYSLTHRRPSPFIELSLSNQSSRAGAALVFTGQPNDGETVSIGKPGNTKVYTWFANTPLPAYGVKIGATEADTAEAFENAVNGEADGTTVGFGTVQHPDAQADDAITASTPLAATGVLSFEDNSVTPGPERFRIEGSVIRTYTFVEDVSSGPAYNVMKGVDLTATIQNAIHAINGTGVAGVNYTAGTVANPDVTANPATPSGSSLRVVAQTAGAAGNAIKTTTSGTITFAWGASTLQGGADASTERVSITARVSGAGGNAIQVSEASTNVTWEPTTAFTGGQDTVMPDPVPTLEVNGEWELVTLGRWYGVLRVEQQRATGEWETIRTYVSQNDKNFVATGTTEGQTLLRLSYTGSGENTDEGPARATLTALDSAVTGLVLITGYTSPTQVTGDVIRDIYSTDPTYEWAGGAWSVRRGFPSAVALHQQRLVFGAGITVTGSQTGGFNNFERLALDDASYTYDLAAYQNSPIVALVSQKSLIVLTESEEWLMDGGQQGAAITPSAIRAERQSGYGAKRTLPLLIHSSVIFIQAGGQTLNEYLFNFGNDGYEAVDLTQLVDHFAEEGLEQIAWAPVPMQALWCSTSSGKLLCMAYRRKSGMIAWTRHDIAGDGIVESVCAVPSAYKEVSSVWIVVRRGNVRTIESIDPTYWDRVRSTDATPIYGIVCADAAVSQEIAASAQQVFGFDHLVGQTIGLLVKGAIHPDRVVQPDGSVSLQDGYVSDQPQIVVGGLKPTVEVQPMVLDIQLRDGASMGKQFRIAKINGKFFQTGACRYADNPAVTYAASYEDPFRNPMNLTNTPVPLFTGLQKLDLGGGWRPETTVILRNNEMLPMNLTALVLELQIG